MEQSSHKLSNASSHGGYKRREGFTLDLLRSVFAYTCSLQNYMVTNTQAVAMFRGPQQRNTESSPVPP